MKEVAEMRTVTLDMRQYDCPFIDTTDDYDLSFTTLHWDFKQRSGELETRIIVDAADRDTLENGLQSLTDHSMMRGCRLLSKRGDTAHIRTTIGETNAMAVVREHDGYITGPFHIENGTELWNIGFDDRDTAETALSGLETNNDFEVDSRDQLDLDVLHRFSRNVDTATTLIEGCMALSETERETLREAVDTGYFDTPKQATLEGLAETFDVSPPTVSKTLRRAQRKLTSHVVDALDDLE
jgi:predicted DNA binding protein